MDAIKDYISKAENKWLDQLYNFCKDQFTQKQIPSHDHTHHLRVWKYSKEILTAINENYKIDYTTVESCLIASLFHDIGLTINLGEDHGKESKNICIKYFEDHQLNKPNNLEEILFAIENHDDKDYKTENKNPDSVLSILCSADDLDAFGNIGVIRYTEIYLLRGINTQELSNCVINNLDKRFVNFEQTYKEFESFYNTHKLRYLETKGFFEDLAKETT